jgi:hypothetical protein
LLLVARLARAVPYPDATPEERRLRLASLWIAREDMIRFWGWDPDRQGR